MIGLKIGVINLLFIQFNANDNTMIMFQEYIDNIKRQFWLHITLIFENEAKLCILSCYVYNVNMPNLLILFNKIED